MCSGIIEVVANGIAIITFLFFLFGAVFKGIQNLSYVKKVKSDSFIMIDDKRATKLSKRPLVLDLRLSSAPIAQNFHIKFSERIFDLELFYVVENEKLFNNCIVTEYGKYDIDFDTSIIDADESLIWSTEIREFYSMGKLTWRTATGMRGEFIPEMGCGRERKHAINIVYKHTLKSRIYHFFQR
jgi:hypothetical protein